MELIRNSFLLPTLKLDDQKFEFIFLLDRSGSMFDGKIELAKRALNLFLHSLPATCYFNIIDFDNVHTPMFPRSVKYDQESLERAKMLLNQIDARGGTDIFSPLQYVYGNPQIPGYLTQIFALTDGNVDSRDNVLQLVASKVKHSRAFALGVGNDVDRILVDGIARNGGGTAEFVLDDPEKSKLGMASSNVLYQIAALQLFDGSFNLDPSLCSIIQVNLTTAKNDCDRHSWNYKAFATTLALAFFLEKLGALQEKWELVADKSKIWLIEKYASQADAMFERSKALVLGK